ncbi:MAG TPA: hypothetical protein PLX58_06275 [Smithellaceae bacterium]|nr:hypothetical protein [Smithellaceae bacterium]HQF84563.1 hypothetical protein [Smithellaceae bacterium]HQG81064.1 hypothetical protein [Smithellaceae bacterium]
MATTWKPSSVQLTSQKQAYPADVIKLSGSFDDVNKLFIGQKWSLGLPIYPPTRERVVAMLKGTSRNPQEVLGKIPPRMATVTVELVAVHATMAGCKPEYMPVLLAIVEALLDPKANWAGINTSTGTLGLVIVINGPVVKDIGIASGQGAAGKMNHANSSIGYAVNLMSAIIGGSRPPDGDKSTFGGPQDYVPWIFGENESKLPKGWQPYHVDRGFKKNDSVVTVLGIYPPVDLTDHWARTADQNLDAWASLATPRLNAGGVCRPPMGLTPHVVVLGPEHAQLAEKDGWTKEQYRKNFWEKVRQPVSWYPKTCFEFINKEPKYKLFVEEQYGIPFTPETIFPLTVKPELIHIIVGGGSGRHSHFFTPFYETFPVSKLVKE